MRAHTMGLEGTCPMLAKSRVRLAALVGTKRRACIRVAAFKEEQKKQAPLHTRVAIIGGGPAAHTAAIYAARAELEPIVFEGWMAGGIAPGGQLTTTTYVENFPGFVEPIMGYELTDKFKAQSIRYGTRVFTETVMTVELPPPASAAAAAASAAASAAAGSGTSSSDGDDPSPRGPFKLWTPERCITADAIILATGASAKRLRFPGSGDETEGGYWNRGISACAICDGSSPLNRNKPVAVVGGGDSAMEEAMFLSRYASRVYVVHRFGHLEASKSMARRALANPKIQVLWNTQVLEAHGNEQGDLGSLTIARTSITEPSAEPSLEKLEVNGLFFAIGHKPATDFIKGVVELDEYGYVVTVPGSTVTSVPGIFAAGDVMDSKYKQAITAAGSGCMAALEAERYLQALDAGQSSEAAAGVAQRGEGGMPQQWCAPAGSSL